jgi:hypothetical protein
MSRYLIRALLIVHFGISSTVILAQQLNQVTFAGGSSLSYFSFITEQDILIRVSLDGQILEYGMEARALRGDYYAPRLQPFAGRIDYYGAEADSVSKGKVKMIGTCAITYYGPFEDSTHLGKVRSIGTLFLDYYNKYENKALRGKLKYAGSQLLEYYSPFENEAYRGKLKAIGNTQITYYSPFDDRNNSGKIKSIGQVKYAWFSAYDRRDMGGGLKNGLYRQRINGVTYILW